MRYREDRYLRYFKIVCISLSLSSLFAAAPAREEERKEGHHPPAFVILTDYKSWTKPEQFEEYLEKAIKDNISYNLTEAHNIEIVRKYFSVLIHTYKDQEPEELIATNLGSLPDIIEGFIRGMPYDTMCVRLAGYIRDKNMRLCEILENRRYDASKVRKPSVIERLYYWATGYAAVGDAAGGSAEKKTS